MAEEKAAAPEGATNAAPKSGGMKLGVLVPVLNSVLILAALGMLVYTQFIFKRPLITESSERKRLEALHASPTPPPVPGLVTFDPVTVNIASNPAAPKPADGTPQQVQGKLHYVYLGFSLELKDSNHKDVIEVVKPRILDAVLTMVGKKSFNDLVTVQGRYVLKTQILDTANELAMKELDSKESPITNVYLNHFIVQ